MLTVICNAPIHT